MKRILRALRPTGGQVATCDTHLALAMRAVTPPSNGEENDTHMIVRRLEAQTETLCTIGAEPATWVLFPQAVLR